MLAGGALGCYVWRIEPHWVEVVHKPMPLPDLPDSLEGKRLVLISDLHMGGRVDTEYLIAAAKRINGLAPDILAICGDLVDNGSKGAMENAKRVLDHLNPGALGSVCVLGNHDYGKGWNKPHVAQKVADLYRNKGFTLLRDQCVEIQGLPISGAEDFWGPNYSVSKSLIPSQRGIALCHNPDLADQPIWGGFQGWILSGHTHGGQCKPPFLDPPLLPVNNKRYTAGEIPLSNDKTLYITRGLGYLLRVRFNVRPEITVFTLCNKA